MRGRLILTVAPLGALALATACGSPSGGSGAGGSAFGAGGGAPDAGVITVSCDDTATVNGVTAHECVLFTGTAAAITAQRAQSSCASESGTLGTSCVTTGTLGSCTGSSMGVTSVI